MLDVWHFIFQILAASIMAWVLHTDLAMEMKQPSIVGKFIFLTTQTILMIFLYFMSNVICECSRLAGSRLVVIESCLNWICCVVAGFAIFICVMFYAVVWPDPVYQVKVAQFEAEGMPLAFNSHLLHCSAVPLILLDTYLKRPVELHQSIGRVRAYLTFFLGYGICYVILVYFNRYKTGAWPYPFLDKFHAIQRLMFFTVALCIAGVICLLYLALLKRLVPSPDPSRTAHTSLPLSRSRTKSPAKES